MEHILNLSFLKGGGKTVIHTYKRQAEMEFFLIQLLEVCLSDGSLDGFHYLLHEILSLFSKMKQKGIKILALQENKCTAGKTTSLVTKWHLP